MYYAERWAADGIHYGVIAGNYTRNARLLWINALTGQNDVRFQSPDGERQTFEFSRVGNLLMLERRQLVERLHQGRLAYEVVPCPRQSSSNDWNLDTWRPLIDTHTWKIIPWPSSLDPSIVGQQDLLMTDTQDPARWLYHSETIADNPWWKGERTSRPRHHFVFLRYLNGSLTVENQWQVNDGQNSLPRVFSKQLFIQGVQDVRLTPWAMSLLSKFPTLENWVMGKWLKLGASYVAQVDPVNGKTNWKLQEREFDGPLPQLGNEFMLIRLRGITSREHSGCECYALPMNIYSPWWSRGTAALIFLAACWLRVRRRASNKK